MTAAVPELPRVLTLAGATSQGARAEMLAHGGLKSLACGDVSITLFPAHELEPGAAQVVLRQRQSGRWEPTPLTGPAAPGRRRCVGGRTWLEGCVGDLAYRLEWVPAAQAAAWFWHLELHNQGAHGQMLDVLWLQDVALAPWSAVRLNEAYVSQYVDHQPLVHGHHGTLIASRQNQPVAGRCPWLLLGSLRRVVGWATDLRQLMAGGWRPDGLPGGCESDLPSRRLQHEHSLVALQDEAFELAPGQRVQRGSFGWFEPDHPAASGPGDLERLQQVLALPEARWSPPPVPDESMATQARPGIPSAAVARPDGPGASLFCPARIWSSRPATIDDMQARFPGPWRHVEHDAQGRWLSFFCDGAEWLAHPGAADGSAAREEAATHVVSGLKQALVMRPHGHLLRSGDHWTPDEQALATTAWMDGVFNAGLAQGHASHNRCLSHQRDHLGLYLSHGQRLFVDAGDGWQLLGRPSAMAMSARRAEWHYLGEVAGGVASHVQVVVEADAREPLVHLRVQVLAGPSLRVMVVHHVAVNGDDGFDESPLHWRDDGRALAIQPAPGSDMAQRFPHGGWRIQAGPGPTWTRASDDAPLFLDCRSRAQPWLCLHYDATRELSLSIRGDLVPQADPAWRDAQGQLPAIARLQSPGSADAAVAALCAQWNDQLPWLTHNALVHYLAPRGLEQYSGGGWGTRDVCQGPVELLLAMGRFEPLRDLLRRVFRAQNADGDWPQWFMFFERDAAVRAADSHGDIVYWPLVALADYLVATGDAGLLDEVEPYHLDDASAPAAGEPMPGAAGAGEALGQVHRGAMVEPIERHVERALALIRRRTVGSTALAAYGHGDWNDALQPANPTMREHLCSAWTVTLHVRMLQAWAAAWQRLDRPERAQAMLAWRDAVMADFQRLLMPQGVVVGYASFEQPGAPRPLLHPGDEATGIRYSALPMVHAILDEVFTPAQAEAHVALIEQHLSGPDGLRLFDRPLRYAGGPMRLFQRGESASYFGREIGLMYMHAHLRWAEALAHLGRAEAFVQALQQAHAIGLPQRVPQASPRQANCYYSSSDAAFDDREQAWADYARIARGEVALEGGWRIYSSGPGIAVRLVVQKLLGLTQRVHELVVDPVMPASFAGCRARLLLYGRECDVHYRVGAAGHGPVRIALDGVDLPWRRLPNAYRTGAAAIDLADLDAARQGSAGPMRLDIELG